MEIDMTKERRIGVLEQTKVRDYIITKEDPAPAIAPEGYRLVKNSRHCWLWALLFGGFYFMYKGKFFAGLVALVLGVATMGISNILFALIAGKIVNG